MLSLLYCNNTIVAVIAIHAMLSSTATATIVLHICDNCLIHKRVKVVAGFVGGL